MNEFKHLKIPLEVIKQATNNFDADKRLGQGGFGNVYKGEFLYSKGWIVAAVKRLDREFGQGDVEFWKEVMLLSCHKHENLISLLGFCDESEEKILVYEYAPNRSLDLYLHSTDLTWIQRLKICLGAAHGLEYLHNPKGTQQRILHRDIKSANILLDENWNAKIADFGLSRLGPANQQYTFVFSGAVGTPGYCDPMYVETMLLTKKSDVYSFGVVLFEVLCGRRCVEVTYDDHHRVLPTLAKNCYKQKKLHMIIPDSLRQQIAPACFDMFTTIAYQCLQRDQANRPSMDLIVSTLETALEHQEGRNVLARNVELESSLGPSSTPNDIAKQGVEEPEKLNLIKVAATTKDEGKVLDLQSKLTEHVEWLPSSLGKLSNITALNLSDKKIMALPSSITNLTALTKLDVHSNQLSNLPDSFGQLVNLLDLNLRDNRLKSLPESFGNLSNLINLDLSSNHFTHLPELIEHLTRMQILIVSKNYIPKLPSSIGSCSSLVELKLDYNQLRVLPEAIGNLRYLEILSLKFNQVRELPRTMVNLTRLRKLDVDFNELEGVPVEIEEMIKENQRN